MKIRELIEIVREDKDEIEDKLLESLKPPPAKRLMTIDLDEVRRFGEVDDNITWILTYDGEYYEIFMSYKEFKKMRL